MPLTGPLAVLALVGASALAGYSLENAPPPVASTLAAEPVVVSRTPSAPPRPVTVASPTATASPTPAPNPAALVARYRNLILVPGSRGPAVSVVQHLLGIPATGVFDAATVAAVKQFQGSHGIGRTGNVGPYTWTALSQLR